MKISLKDIAKELNLAVSTISRALNGSYGVHPKTIERVQQKAREMGYVPISERSNSWARAATDRHFHAGLLERSSVG
ncbi:helix-turn-helix domain-containing protein [Paenibacillus profundus]|uniref:Helix-turn-helix domain-containing protein n=1 Tax=Paenibacillus profundus TaxID=1173085 RepID=A0ABS8YF33_9BACL|nr:helix-turn-helix domain-containing protein [Paenibacillus profundus]MCE5170281.1 helix-turn-helix domain-containing protein [Paenibacillus profundus]